MSSDSIIPVQYTVPDSLQGMQTSSQQPAQKSRESGPDSVLPQRQTDAASGQDLPLNEVNDRVPEEEVESAVSQISDFVQNFQRDLLFSIDKESDRLVVKVVDSETQEVIRQIPSEETLRIARNLDSLDSLILREQA